MAWALFDYFDVLFTDLLQVFEILDHGGSFPGAAMRCHAVPLTELRPGSTRECSLYSALHNNVKGNIAVR
jgi:hypothetical protein